MYAFSWTMLRDDGVSDRIHIYLIDRLIVRVNTHNGRQESPLLFIEGNADYARARTLEWTADFERLGFEYGGDTYTAEVPEHLVEALRGWLRNEPTDFSSEKLLVSLSPHWEVLT